MKKIDNENDEATYFKDWYRRNGDALNRRRRQRYRLDREYRERVRRTNAESRARRRRYQEVGE